MNGRSFLKRSVKNLTSLTSANANNEERIYVQNRSLLTNRWPRYLLFSLFVSLNRDHVIKVSIQTFFTVKHNI